MPADEGKLRDATSRALKAQQLCDDPVLSEAFDKLDAAYLEAWRATHAQDTNAREKLFLAVNVAAKVREHLRIIIANGRLAQKDLDQLENDRKRGFLSVVTGR